MGQACHGSVSLLLTFHGLELSHEATLAVREPRKCGLAVSPGK